MSDSVKVKISEKYRPPPDISLPQAVNNRLQMVLAPDGGLSSVSSYGFELESSVLRKIGAWRQVRELEVNERQERIRIRQDERQKRIEQHQKQLLTQVSYPSTEDLSSGEEEPVQNGKTPVTEAPNVERSAPKPVDKPNHLNFDKILMPTIVPESNNNTSSSFLIVNAAAKKVNGEGQSGSTPNWLNFSEFEMNDNPFDNMEMKTINDLDILAEVLHTTRVNGGDESEKTKDEESHLSKSSPTEVKPEESNKSNHEENNNVAWPETNPNPLPPLPQFAAYQTHSIVNNHMNYYQPQQPLQQYSQYYFYNPMPTNYSNPSPVQPQPEAVNRLKSKSVPDIMAELNEEIQNSEMKRTRNNSQSVEEASSISVRTNPVVAAAAERSSRFNNCDIGQCSPKKAVANLRNFESLAPESKELALKISRMGFAIDVVAAVIKQLGNDDKKIIEHLIPLSELLDLGFGVSSTSQALLKFNNNRDRALDFLIS